MISKRVTLVEEVIHGGVVAPHITERRHPSPSFTNEVAESVGQSIAPSMHAAMRPSIIAQIVAGILIAGSVIASIFIPHH